MKRYSILLMIVLLLLNNSCVAREQTWQYAALDGAISNPLTGNVWWAEDLSPRPQPISLVYANITWAQLEPQEGEYAFEALEEANHFAYWRDQGVHIILRFVMDMPGKSAHQDLPDWLVRRVNGQAYSVSYGRGWCPDYGDPELLEAHGRAVAALGERYDSDPFVSFVELGSLGHWGEWHVHEDAGTMPDEAVRELYVADYLEAFPQTQLLMRRPFRIAAQQGLGLYNDMAGNREATLRWLDWVRNGGAYADEPQGLAAMPEGWKTGAVGGELATDRTPEALLREEKDLLALFQQSHTSWIGPHSFSTVEDESLQQTRDDLMAGIGYRLRVSESTLRGEMFYFTMVNDGIAPFYYPWQVRLRLTNQAGETVFLDSDLDLREVLPGQQITASVYIPRSVDFDTIEVGILDPMTETPALRLAMDVPVEDGWHTLVQP